MEEVGGHAFSADLSTASSFAFLALCHSFALAACRLVSFPDSVNLHMMGSLALCACMSGPSSMHPLCVIWSAPL